MVVGAIEWPSSATESSEIYAGRKVGLVGPGYWGNKVLLELRRHPLVNKIVIVGEDDELSDIYDDNDITHVFVTSPVSTHFDICKKMIRAGKKRVMCEKNFTPTLYTAELLTLQSSYAGMQLMVDFIYSFNPSLDAIRHDLAANPLQPGEEIVIKLLQNGVLRGEHVMSVLGSHALAILGTITDISGAKLVSRLFLPGQEDKAAHVVYLLANEVRASIDVSLIHHEKVRTLRVSTRPEIQLDYPNGIRTMIDRFFSGEDNTTLALNVAKCLEIAK